MILYPIDLKNQLVNDFNFVTVSDDLVNPYPAGT